MRKILLFVAVIACFGISLGNTAQAADIKIGIFDITVVGNESEAYKAQLTTLQKQFDVEGKKLEKEGEAFQKEINDFQVQQQALSADAREERQVALQRKKRDLDDKLNNFMRKKTAAERNAMEQINKVIIYAASELGKREKYAIIMERQNAGALWVDPQYDISKDVLKEANKVWKEKPKAVFGGK